MFNPFNLASDLMEPFRIIVDKKVVDEKFETFMAEDKRRILDMLNETVNINARVENLQNAIKIYCKSVFDVHRLRERSCLHIFPRLCLSPFHNVRNPCSFYRQMHDRDMPRKQTSNTGVKCTVFS